MWSYIDQFTQVSIDIEGTQKGHPCWIFENGLPRDHPFRKNLGERKVKPLQEMLAMAKPFFILKEKLSMCFHNFAFTDSHSNLTVKKESHRRWDDSGREMLGKYNKYTPISVSREKIYQDCINTKFRKAGIQLSYSVRKASQTGKSKYCSFH